MIRFAKHGFLRNGWKKQKGWMDDCLTARMNPFGILDEFLRNGWLDEKL